MLCDNLLVGSSILRKKKQQKICLITSPTFTLHAKSQEQEVRISRESIKTVLHETIFMTRFVRFN